MQFNPIRFNYLRWLLAAGLCLPLITMADSLKVVASIKPIHSLVAGVMQGVAEPLLLVPGGASPHDYSLKPSEVRALAQANLVFWIGPELERFMVRPLASTDPPVRAVALLEAPGVTRLPLRKGGGWEGHAHEAQPHETSRPLRPLRPLRVMRKRRPSSNRPRTLTITTITTITRPTKTCTSGLIRFKPWLWFDRLQQPFVKPILPTKAIMLVTARR